MKKLLLSISLAVAISGVALAQSDVAVLRPGDALEIRLGSVPADYVTEVTSNYNVDDQGCLNLPFITPVKVSGLSVSQAQAAIEKKYRDDEIYSRPTIIITMQTGGRFITMGGAVRQPGRIQYTTDLTLLSAINASGGANEFASDAIFIIRNSKREKYSMKKLRKDPTLDPKILPGDQIEVGTSWF